MNVVKFNEGFLPVRYLGVPLISTKLKSKDCDQLVERIIRRIKSWTNRYLSYAGRAQLITSIFFSMQVYWSSLFILPKKVITAIESLFRSFFWSGCDLRKHGAKVSWEKVCSPKSEGGLGLSLSKFGIRLLLLSMSSPSSWVASSQCGANGSSPIY